MEDNKKKAEEILKKTAEVVRKFYVDEQTKYFSLLEEINNNNKYTEIYSKNMFKVSISDQIPVLELMAKLIRKQKQLCEEYDFLLKEDLEEL